MNREYRCDRFLIGPACRSRCVCRGVSACVRVGAGGDSLRGMMGPEKCPHLKPFSRVCTTVPYRGRALVCKHVRRVLLFYIATVRKIMCS